MLLPLHDRMNIPSFNYFGNSNKVTMTRESCDQFSYSRTSSSCLMNFQFVLRPERGDVRSEAMSCVQVHGSLPSSIMSISDIQSMILMINSARDTV